MSYRRDRRTSATRPRARPGTTHRARPYRSGSRHDQPQSRRPIVIAAIAGVVVILSVVGFFIVRALLGSEPTPTPSSTIGSPSPTLIDPASPNPISTETGVIPQTTSTSPPMPSLTPPPLNLPTMQRLMLALINDNRTAAGLSPVAWDQTAGLAAQAHAEEMAQFGYLSHWDLSGHGPAYRYSQAGGLDASQENVYAYWNRYTDGQPAPIDNWEEVVREAQSELMTSPGHRANILTPEHTNVGIGIAYNPALGDVRIVQLFTNHYVQIAPLPTQAVLGESITLQGRLESGTSEPLLNLAYEPFPEPMSVDQLNNTDVYNSAAEIYTTANLVFDGEKRFEYTFAIGNQGKIGLYYVRVWVNSQHGLILGNEIIIEVR